MTTSAKASYLPVLNPTLSAAGEASARPEQTKLHFVREVTVHYRGPRRAKVCIRGAKGAADFIRRVLPDNAREHFVTLYLDSAHQIAAFSVTATGSADSCPIHPREIFQNAVLIGAKAIIGGHNHPSGDLSPSSADRQITARLKEAGALLGITVLDHVIVGEDSFYSFSDSG